MIRKRSAGRRDIEIVMKQLSAVSKDELAHARVAEDEATAMMIDLWVGHGAVTILNRTQPIAILIFEPVDSRTERTTFLATEAFFDGHTMPTRFLRRYLDFRMANKPGVSLESRTYSNHPELARWYQLMGYHAGVKNPDGSHTFIRPSRS